MKPAFGVVGTAYATVLCSLGIIFMAILGVGYHIRYPQLAYDLTPADASDAAWSCYYAAGVYAILTAVMLWQCWLHWNASRGGSSMISPKAISLHELSPKTANKKQA